MTASAALYVLAVTAGLREGELLGLGGVTSTSAAGAFEWSAHRADELVRSEARWPSTKFSRNSTRVRQSPRQCQRPFLVVGHKNASLTQSLPGSALVRGRVWL